MAGIREAYEQYGKAVYRFLLKLTGNEDIAEELLQETFYQAFLHIDRFEGRCSLYTWLCQIGKNAWIKEYKRNKRFTGLVNEKERPAPTQFQPEETYLRKEEYRNVWQAIMGLEEPYRDVFILHAYGGIRLKEIAFSYGKTESWARVTYYRARQQIVKEVSE